MISAAQRHNEQKYPKFREHGSSIAPEDISKHQETVLNADLKATTLFDKISPLYYKERVHLFFLVSERFRPDFILIRGLLEFHRPKEFLFSYDREQRSISVDIDLDQAAQLWEFLSGVHDWTIREKQFRHALKLAIQFEDRYRLERESVYEILYNTTAVKGRI